MKQLIPALLLMAGLADGSAAQMPQSSQSVTRTIESAMRLADGGQLSEARAIVDSLLRASSIDSSQLADALFARATLAPSVLDASLDYERLIREFPTSGRREQSLLRVAQRSLLAGDNAKAMEYLRTMMRDYRADSSQAIAGYWTARVLLEQHAIASMRDSTVRTTSHPTQAAMVPVGAPTRTIYAVQVSAYAARADAEMLSKRLKKDGLDAHVDGIVKPFRVRVGHYSTYAEAAAALRQLNARNLTGFVAEISP